ncbi:hypothetical protein A3206_07560 [Candidatus Methanomassiliicoccus intestinalis]|uniref:Sortase-related acyltransferase n=1 Tax=Methanomassiliicoccus intestinalis (strain Issoire-Mx1) TaxID=1295009 RepID=R9T479_METII|nr:GNAT family N-acetyltransferase [Candidatus Methanomassiliicoccus intestinalis]AGN25687.1 Sortase-related acyltransferase [Candidatus Methanomassiliicoccus intestinalis Issoire-Mx1]TQS82803.1 MAG: hypothetical protein A3206_07560 [Candidatus Methanomassiliicoccus intestinalis]
MEIVPLSDDDRVSVRLLELACIREYAEVTLELDWNIDIPKEVRDSIGASAPKSFGYYKDTGLCFVAKERGQIVGVIFSQMLHWIDSVENVAWVENICVDEEFRRMGIGYLLMRRLAQEAKNQGAQIVQSSIGLKNMPSLLLHRKLNFLGEDRKIATLDLSTFKI